MSTRTMSFLSDFKETNALSDFDVDAFNNTRGTSSMGDTFG